MSYLKMKFRFGFGVRQSILTSDRFGLAKIFWIHDFFSVISS